MECKDHQEMNEIELNKIHLRRGNEGKYVILIECFKIKNGN